MHAMDEEVARAAWFDLCHQAWTEQDPVKLVDLTMQITKFLARKQQLLDAAFDEAQQQGQPTNPTQPKNVVN
jgi:hypothetical protein